MRAARTFDTSGRPTGSLRPIVRCLTPHSGQICTLWLGFRVVLTAR